LCPKQKNYLYIAIENMEIINFEHEESMERIKVDRIEASQ